MTESARAQAGRSPPFRLHDRRVERSLRVLPGTFRRGGREDDLRSRHEPE